MAGAKEKLPRAIDTLIGAGPIPERSIRSSSRLYRFIQWRRKMRLCNHREAEPAALVTGGGESIG
jgi:hypothetical protein